MISSAQVASPGISCGGHGSRAGASVAPDERAVGARGTKVFASVPLAAEWLERVRGGAVDSAALASAIAELRTTTR